MSTDLLFINHIAKKPVVDASTKRQIKQHVMRDIGLTRRRRQRVVNSTRSKGSTALCSDDSASNRRSSGLENDFRLQTATRTTCLECTKGPSTFPSSSLPSDCYALDVQSSAMRSKQEIVFRDATDHVCISKDTLEASWSSPEILNNENSWKEHIKTRFLGDWPSANYSTIPSQATSSPTQLTVSNYETITLIRRKLFGLETRHSESTLAMICAAGGHSLLLGIDDVAVMHIKGARALVQARGGLQTLSPKFQYLVSFGDVIFSYRNNEAPGFKLSIGSISDFRIFCGNIVGPKISRVMLQAWSTKIPQHATYIHLVNYLMILITRLREDLDDVFNTQLPRVSNYIKALLHRFQTQYLDILDGTENDTILSCVRLTIPLVLAEPRRRFGISPNFNKKYTTDLQTALQLRDTEWQGLEILRLWICAMGASESSDVIRAWFHEEMLRIVQNFCPRVQLRLMKDVRDMMLEKQPSLGDSINNNNNSMRKLTVGEVLNSTFSASNGMRGGTGYGIESDSDVLICS